MINKILQLIAQVSSLYEKNCRVKHTVHSVPPKKKIIQSRRIFPLPVPMPLSSSPALLLRIHEQSPPAAETQCKLPATNSNAQECQYPLARCAFHMYVRGEETQKVSICDYSLV